MQAGEALQYQCSSKALLQAALHSRARTHLGHRRRKLCQCTSWLCLWDERDPRIGRPTGQGTASQLEDTVLNHHRGRLRNSPNSLPQILRNQSTHGQFSTFESTSINCAIINPTRRGCSVELPYRAGLATNEATRSYAFAYT